MQDDEQREKRRKNSGKGEDIKPERRCEERRGHERGEERRWGDKGG